MHRFCNGMAAIVTHCGLVSDRYVVQIDKLFKRCTGATPAAICAVHNSPVLGSSQVKVMLSSLSSGR